jgi:two-component SAPR family response regulator
MPVRIRAREGLDVETELADPDEKKSAKPAQKLRELLAVLVARPRGATHAELIDWLWPDAEGDKAQSSLKVATHRLRQWLGADAVKVDAGRTRLDPTVVGCDVWGPVSVDETEEVLAGFDLPPVLALRRRLKAGMRA